MRSGVNIKRMLPVILTVVMAAAAFSLLLPGYASAFHEGGEGFCEGCHIIRGSEEGRAAVSGQEVYLLKGSDPSSTCLRCHAKRGKKHSVLSRDGSRFTPGGDFYWLGKTFSRLEYGIIYRSPGDSHGHNVVAGEYGLTADSMHASAPGGVYPSRAMGCTSCHNPHGLVSGGHNYGRDLPFSETGNFRLLGGIGYSGGSGAGGKMFSYPAPVAAASENWTETDNDHTAYGSGMSEWCANCHYEFLHDHGGKHVSGSNARLGNSIISNYNSYVKSGDFSGTYASAYLALVPFESGAKHKDFLNTSGSSGPATGEAKVMCLTCHRAHASAFHRNGRWDFRTTFIADSIPGNGDSGVSGNDVLNSYYGRNMPAEFGKYQRQLCNKCHVQD